MRKAQKSTRVFMTSFISLKFDWGPKQRVQGVACSTRRGGGQGEKAPAKKSRTVVFEHPHLTKFGRSSWEVVPAQPVDATPPKLLIPKCFLIESRSDCLSSIQPQTVHSGETKMLAAPGRQMAAGIRSRKRRVRTTFLGL